MEEYDGWSLHHKAMREHPEYQMLGLLDCLREELMMNMPVVPDEKPREEIVSHYHFRLSGEQVVKHKKKSYKYT